MNSNVFIRRFLCAFFLAMLTLGPAALAKDDKPKPNDKPKPTVPIDGGISALLAAGIGLGVRKILQKRKQLEQ